jgi:peptide/nickel transport system substrate-binding protein
MNRFIIILFIVLLFAGSLFICGIAGSAERILRSSWSWPTYIDPAVGSDFSSSAALVHLYDPLVFPDKEMNPQPHIAKSWKISSDGRTWTFYIRQGIMFHDGTELTADDVKFSMDRLTTIGEGFAFLFVERIISTEILNKYTIVFHLKEPFAPFLGALYRFFVVNKDLVMTNIKRPGPYSEMGDYGKTYLLTNDAGSGPYMVKEFALEEYLLMTKNPNYWQQIDSFAPNEVKMYGTTEPITVRTMMARRELEFSDAWQSEEALEAMDNIKGVDIAQHSTGNEWYLMIHTRKPPTDCVHFRRAMAWAFDYKTMTEFFPGCPQARGPVPQTLPGADSTLLQYNRDLNKAMEELKQSKYYGQLDKYHVEFHWNSDVPVTEKVALLFMSNMADIGINVKIMKTPWLSMVENTARMETSPNILIINDVPQYPEAGSLLESRYKSNSAPTWEQNEWLLDSEYDAMIDDALRTMDRQKRFIKYSKIQHYIMDLCPSIFLVELFVKNAYQANYIDGPVFRAEAPSLMGYDLDSRFIKIYPEKRYELLK